MENAPKITLEQIQAPIADRIRSYERYIASILHSDNAYVGSISDYILGNRGKQLRPLLVLLSAALHGEIGQRSYMGASLVEMIHTASLIHDDVVDEAYVRRGKPSVNALWHARTAVLIGDYIFARTYHVCLQNKGWDMLTEVTRSIHEVSEGELIQTEQTEKLAMTREIYYDIIYKKTAALLGACGATGAISVGADEEHVNRMREFGNNLGVAFQIKDDILDYSPMEVTGKPTGGDMRERKITLPLLYVLEQSTPGRTRPAARQAERRAQQPGPCRIPVPRSRAGGRIGPRPAVHGRVPRQGARLFGRIPRFGRTAFAAPVRRLRSLAGQIAAPAPGSPAAAAPKRGPGPEARL